MLEAVQWVDYEKVGQESQRMVLGRNNVITTTRDLPQLEQYKRFQHDNIKKKSEWAYFYFLLQCLIWVLTGGQKAQAVIMVTEY